MGYGSDPYSKPEAYGLTTIGEIEWSEPCYDFDLTVVWRDPEGELYWADDTGCSCPSPFEDFDTREQLTTGSVFELAAHLEKRRTDYAAPQIVDLLERIRLNGGAR